MRAVVTSLETILAAREAASHGTSEVNTPIPEISRETLASQPGLRQLSGSYANLLKDAEPRTSGLPGGNECRWSLVQGSLSGIRICGQRPAWM